MTAIGHMLVNQLPIMPTMGGRKKSTVTPPCYSQLGVIAEDSDYVSDNLSPVSPRHKHSVIREEPEDEPDSDLGQVVQTATKLNLMTRRASTAAWRAQYLDKPALPQVDREDVPEEDGKLTSERKTRINKALEWIKTELVELRRQDQSIARQLLGIRRDISRLRLSRRCEDVEDMMEDVQVGMEEMEELSKVLDLPYEGPLSPSPLKQIGVTKMNFSLRRFSTC